MRCPTASQIKGVRCAPVQPLPREGTRTRQVYDLLQANKGRPVDVGMRGPKLSSTIRNLEDFYGLDIRWLQNGSSRTGRQTLYMLAGEWFGRVYIDYVAEAAQ